MALYMRRAGLDQARIVPLTPDASDRRYLRVIPRQGPAQVLAVYPGPIDYAQMTFALVASLDILSARVCANAVKTPAETPAVSMTAALRWRPVHVGSR